MGGRQEGLQGATGGCGTRSPRDGLSRAALAALAFGAARGPRGELEDALRRQHVREAMPDYLCPREGTHSVSPDSRVSVSPT